MSNRIGQQDGPVGRRHLFRRCNTSRNINESCGHISANESGNVPSTASTGTQTCPDRTRSSFGSKSLHTTSSNGDLSSHEGPMPTTQQQNQMHPQTSAAGSSQPAERVASATTTTGRRRLQDGMATALSVDHWTAPATSQCEYDANPDLSVNFVCMHPPIPNGVANEGRQSPSSSSRSRPNLPAAARYQEIFIDLCALYASSYDAASRHVLDSRFDSFLGEGEREFKNAVLDLVRGGGGSGSGNGTGSGENQGDTDDGTSREGGGGGLSDAARQTSAYRRLERMLRREMGLGTLDERQEMRVRKMRGLRRESLSAEEENGCSSRSSAAGSNRKLLHKAVSNASLGSTTEEGDCAGSNVSSDVLSENNENVLERQDASHHANSKNEALRDFIVRIRSDDCLFRQFALAGDNIDALVEEVITPILPSTLCPNDIRELLDEQQYRDASIHTEAQALKRLVSPPGHVFVINGSVCDVSVDAFLCPGTLSKKKNSVAGTIFRRWYETLCDTNANLLSVLRGPDDGSSSSGGGRRRRSRSRGNSGGSDSEMRQRRSIYRALPMKHYEEYDRVCTPKYWPWAEFWRKDEFDAATSGLFRVPYLVAGEVSIERSCAKGSNRAVPSEQDHIDALIETVRQFVLVSLKELRREQPRPRANRERYLLALPVVGTGGGNAGDLTGQVVSSMMLALSELVASNTDVDCVIVCADLATFSHAQNVRWRMYEKILSNKEANSFDIIEPLSSFRLFTPDMRDHCAEPIHTRHASSLRRASKTEQ